MLRKFEGFGRPEASNEGEKAEKIERKEQPEEKKETTPRSEERRSEREASPESKEKNLESTLGLLQATRLPKERMGGIIPVSPEDRKILRTEVEHSLKNLDACYQSNFGIFPTGDPDDNFYNTLWLRDLAHAGGNFFAENNDTAVIDSLETAFLYQKEDGSLPYRIERKYFLAEHVVRALSGFKLSWLKKIGIDLVTRKKEKPIYEGEQGGNADDTIPTVTITTGELFIHSSKGRDFIKSRFGSIEKAMQQFLSRTDPADGLEISRTSNPDWADSLIRGGKKISTVNIWQARALQMMRFMSTSLDRPDRAAFYGERYLKVKNGIMEKLYDAEHHYFRSAEGESRIDAAASIFGSLYILPVQEAVKVEETMDAYLRSNSGLRNFYPPYPKNRVYPILRLIGMGGYHNKGVWPWLTAQNIQVKIRIALEQEDTAIREQYKKEAVEDLVDVAKLFEDAGGAYEVFDPDTRKPATWLRTLFRRYEMPKNLMGNLAAFQSAYHQLKKLGWLEDEA